MSKKKRLVEDLIAGDKVYIPVDLVSLHSIIKIEDISSMFASGPKGRIITVRSESPLHKGRECKLFMLDEDKIDTKARPTWYKRLIKWLFEKPTSPSKKHKGPLIVHNGKIVPPLLANATH